MPEDPPPGAEMGSFYTNVTVRHDRVDEVVDALERLERSAFVGPPADGCCVVFDEATEAQDAAEIERLGKALSKRLRCAALAVLVHADDLLYYVLFESGRMTDEYASRPGFLDGDDRPPEGGTARALAAAFDAHDRAGEVKRVLHRGAYARATERHAELVAALGLPEAAVGTGYHYIAAGELPPGLDADRLRAVGDAEAGAAPSPLPGAALSAEEVEAVRARMAAVVRPSPEIAFLCGTEPIAYGSAIGRVIGFVVERGLARAGTIHPDAALAPVLGPEPLDFGQLPLVLRRHFTPVEEGARRS